MRIRTQLLAAALTSIVIGLGAVLAVLAAARQEAETEATQARAQITAHEVTGLLVLTQDYARHAEAGTALQWGQRHAAIVATLAQESGHAHTSAALSELQSVTHALPQLFARLQEIPADGSSFSARRSEVLLDQMLASAQAMSDHAYQWYQDSAQRRREAEQRFQMLAVAVPLLMLAMLLGLAMMIKRRVLDPLKRLDDAARAVGSGDLTVRSDSTAQDELGDLARRFDQMAAHLAQARIDKLVGRALPQKHAPDEPQPTEQALRDPHNPQEQRR